MLKQDKKALLKKYHLINDILTEWNPLGVPENITDEYSGYIPRVVKAGGSKEGLIKVLEQIIMEDMGLSYNPDDPTHKATTVDAAERMIRALHYIDLK